VAEIPVNDDGALSRPPSGMSEKFHATVVVDSYPGTLGNVTSTNTWPRVPMMVGNV
jgi:hypothetical protein